MPPWLSTIVASIASVLVAVISSSWFSKRMMRKDILDELSRRLDNVDSALSEMANNDAKLKQANVALLRDRFMFLSKNAINEGSITFDELQTIKDLSVPYFELDDVTGEGKVLLSKVEQLPIKN
jgi:hypothetical protein